MTELEILKRARGYLDQLAHGVNPLDHTPIPDTDVVRQVRIAKCLTYVTGVLDQEIRQQERPRQRDKVPFALPEEQRKWVKTTVEPVLITELCRRINARIDQNTMQKLSGRSMTGWLLSQGLLQEAETETGHLAKRPTEAGRALGITEEARGDGDRSYWLVLYGWKAQKLLLEHLDEIAALAQQPPPEREKLPWQPEEDAYLLEQYGRHAAIQEMAEELKRKPSSVRARLRKLLVPN